MIVLVIQQEIYVSGRPVIRARIVPRRALPLNETIGDSILSEYSGELSDNLVQTGVGSFYSDCLHKEPVKKLRWDPKRDTGPP